MRYVKIYYEKTGDNPLIHLIVSLDDSVTSDKDACIIADKIARFYMGDYQVLWGVHAKKRSHSDYHIHLIINSVSYVNGNLFRSGFGEMNYLRSYLKKVTKKNVFMHYDGR